MKTMGKLMKTIAKPMQTIENNENHWKTMKTIEKPMKPNENHCKTNENQGTPPASGPTFLGGVRPESTTPWEKYTPTQPHLKGGIENHWQQLKNIWQPLQNQWKQLQNQWKTNENQRKTTRY